MPTKSALLSRVSSLYSDMAVLNFAKTVELSSLQKAIIDFQAIRPKPSYTATHIERTLGWSS